MLTSLIYYTIFLVSSALTVTAKEHPIFDPLKLGESVSGGGVFYPEGGAGRSEATKNLGRLLIWAILIPLGSKSIYDEVHVNIKGSQLAPRVISDRLKPLV